MLVTDAPGTFTAVVTGGVVFVILKIQTQTVKQTVTNWYLLVPDLTQRNSSLVSINQLTETLSWFHQN